MRSYLRILVLALCAAAAFGAGAAVEPVSTDRYGNPEETALRPYKWVWRGLGALFYQTGRNFRDGNYHTPVLGTANTLRGVRMGSFELLESTYKGFTFAPVPPKGDFKQLRRWNTRIEESNGGYHVADFAFSWFLYPAILLVDNYPVNDDEEVAAMLEHQREVREARRASRPDRRDGMTDVEWAQKRYIGDRRSYGKGQ